MALAQILGRADVAGRLTQLKTPLVGGTGVVWRALTDPEQAMTWLGRMSPAPSGRGSIFEVWHDDRVRSRHEVLQWQPERSLRITWEFPDETTSDVTFFLEDRGPQTEVIVCHENLDDPVSYAAGWHRHLEYLDAHLRGNDGDLADFWEGYPDLLARYRMGNDGHEPIAETRRQVGTAEHR